MRTRSCTGALRRSAEPVKVVSTDQAHKEAADLGEVLARTEGVGVRRSGALGSSARLSLGGLTDDQVRVLLDGIPLQMSGFDVGIGNLPVNFVQRIEIYSGVVPIRFGADALGGVVNIVTQPDAVVPAASLSYQAGSWDSHRLTAGATAVTDGWTTRLHGFLDSARNDYLIDVQVPDDVGRLSPAVVRRFHDAYRAGGGGVEAGVVHKPWAEQLLLRGFGTQTHRQLQHNAVMTRPYGEVTSQRTRYGVLARYKQPLTEALDIDGSLAWGWTRSNFIDLSPWLYDWFGQKVMPRQQPGETDSTPHDRTEWQQTGAGRFNLAWQLLPEHSLQLSVAPTYTMRTGVERRLSTLGSVDPWRGNAACSPPWWGWPTRAIGSTAACRTTCSQKATPTSRTPRPRPTATPWAAATCCAMHSPRCSWPSFPMSTPRACQIPMSFLATPSPSSPTPTSPPSAVTTPTWASPCAYQVTLGSGAPRPKGSRAWRKTSSCSWGTMSPLPTRMFTAPALWACRAPSGWTSPGGILSLDGAGTWQDFRNVSPQGAFGAFDGDRIPNRPWLFLNAAARLTLPQALTANDSLSLAWYMRYVQAFYRGWESAGLAASKQTIPTQRVHSAALVWAAPMPPFRISMAAEVDNVLDSNHYDVYGVQLPGRSVSVKATVVY